MVRDMRLPLTDGHVMYYEEHGSPTGRPVVVLHGGPGGGIQRKVLEFFNLKKWRVILYDQRGCGRSTPFGSINANTTCHLVADLERLRVHLGLESWTLFGGSWGSTLALAYAARYKENVTAMVLRGVCLMEPWEQRWLYEEGGASRLYPEEWAKFVAGAGGPKKNLTRAYSRRLRSRHRGTRRAAARAWWSWEAAVSHLKPRPDRTPVVTVESLAILENHYFRHNAWIKPGSLVAAARGFQFPIHIVQGRYDLVCPAASAVAIARAAPNAKLVMTIAGHSTFEPETALQLRKLLDNL
jgi:proline iminopeptidase